MVGQNQVSELNKLSSSSTSQGGVTSAIASANQSLASNRNRLAALQMQLEVNQAQINTAFSALVEVREIVNEVKMECAETDRMIIKAFIASAKLLSYQDTADGFKTSFADAEALGGKVKFFSKAMETTDDASAQMVENNFVTPIKGQPAFASLIVANATSQIGTHETSDNFVAGKPYGQMHVAWCGDFASWVMESSGIPVEGSGRGSLSSNRNIAKAWARYGDAGGGYGRWGSSADAQVGDLLIDRYDGSASTGGHISIVVETNIDGDPNRVRAIGGNESDQVKESVKTLTSDNRYLVTLAELKIAN